MQSDLPVVGPAAVNRVKEFLCIGECMVELSAAGPDLWRQGFAGDVLNTAWYARAALPNDWAVRFFTAVGCDPISDQMVGFIEEAGISCDGIPHIADKMPGLYAIHLDGAERSFSYWRDSSAARQMLSEPRLLWTRISQADVVYLSGITLGILPVGDAELLIDGLKKHSKDGALIALDPNIRPRLWPDPVRMRNIISSAASVSDIVMPSFDDEAQAFGDVDSDATARRYLDLGAGIVVVKNGTNATMVATADNQTTWPVPPVPDVVDTTAAGDSFNGGFLAEYVRSKDISRSVLAAQACSGRVVRFRGALIPREES